LVALGAILPEGVLAGVRASPKPVDENDWEQALALLVGAGIVGADDEVRLFPIGGPIHRNTHRHGAASAVSPLEALPKSSLMNLSVEEENLAAIPFAVLERRDSDKLKGCICRNGCPLRRPAL